MFGFRNSREQPFREHVQKLAVENPNIRLHVSYSSPLPEDVWYRDYNHRGRVTIERVREALPSNNFRFYVCGPGEMMESLVPALWEWGVPESHVHFEAFGPASVKRVAAGNAAQRSSEPCDVRFERSDRDVTWDGSCASLLEFGEASGHRPALRLPGGKLRRVHARRAERSGAAAQAGRHSGAGRALLDVHQRAGGRAGAR